jgi:hypothetical protein
MKQITENYCNFEIAKLLKEKGVDFIDCVTYYCEDKPKEVNYSFCGETNSTWEKRCCQAPTQSLALKWLREVHRIETHIVLSELNTDNSRKYMFDIYSSDINRDFDSATKEGFNSYEQAVEAALKYTLENLI